ncbi:MAG: c-type cytochrome [Deltaproteobacteria bacterium]|nr:c-type cytochrome [Deltaproteobacteria bacterium]
MQFLKNALVQTVIVLLLGFVVLELVQPPIPLSLLMFYMSAIAVGMAVYSTSTTERMESFWAPIRTLLVSPSLKLLRIAVLTAIPAGAAVLTAFALIPSNSAPATLRVIHPAPPGSITFEGKPINLREAVNPFRELKGTDQQAFAGKVELGREVYFKNCFQCHGDHLDGEGPFAKAFNPRPANFQDVGTIAQLQESYLFWRIAKGGPGLPAESTPGRSAMPRWEGILNTDQIWAVILFLYEKTGHPPRTWE